MVELVQDSEVCLKPLEDLVRCSEELGSLLAVWELLPEELEVYSEALEMLSEEVP